LPWVVSPTRRLDDIRQMTPHHDSLRAIVWSSTSRFSRVGYSKNPTANTPDTDCRVWKNALSWGKLSLLEAQRSRHVQRGCQMIAVASSTRTAGFWSAVAATALSLTYVVGQIAEWLGWLGSRGGPESVSTPLGILVLLTPSLFLGPAFVVVMASIHEMTSVEKRVWSLSALAFAVAYVVLIGMNYFVQLTLVGPRMARGDTAGIEMFVFVPFTSFLYAVDILGYSFMSVATLLAGLTFSGGGLRRVVRWCLVANGLLLPFLALQMYYHSLIWFASLWAVTFPGAMWSLALLFRRLPHEAVDSSPAPGDQLAARA